MYLNCYNDYFNIKMTINVTIKVTEIAAMSFVRKHIFFDFQFMLRIKFAFLDMSVVLQYLVYLFFSY